MNIVDLAKSLHEQPAPDRIQVVRDLVAQIEADLKVWERSEWYYPPRRGARAIRITPQWLAFERASLADLKRWLARHETSSQIAMLAHDPENG